MNADPHDISPLHRVRIEGLERFVDDLEHRTQPVSPRQARLRQRGVITAVPNETSLGLIGWMRMSVGQRRQPHFCRSA